ncbi:cupin domain-containing protein [Haloarchaeobius amylolyticus]|uniref:cupin domain-containing protein n=1 Tax=Haloarchaeobius amylolyticus TaxID=1198296 RepID=UPI0022700ED5|nr:cupin domain-containing protein [Haloarchaeobius amylolyticus]
MTTIRNLKELEGAPHATVFEGAEPKTIRLTLDAGERVEPHQHPGRTVVLHVLEGGITLHLGEESFELSGGDIAHFDGDRSISPVATEASTALVILARTPEERD